MDINMKKIERLCGVYSQEQLLNYGMISRKVNELIDSHNELLDTHTVKEEPLKNWKGCPDCFYGEGEDHDIECESSKEKPTTPEKSMTLPDGKEVRTSYSEIFDQDGKSIEGITAIQAFNGAIIVATANKMYCNNPEIFKTSSSFEEVATPEKRCVCGEHEILGGAEVERGGVCHRPNNPCYIIEETELPTSSYEVTCGRCEKSISHKCGRV